MTEITLHRARIPSEDDVFEVKVSNHVAYTGKLFFEKNGEDEYKEIDSSMNEGHDVTEWIVQAAKALIRERDAKVVKDMKGNIVAELKTGEVYL